MSSTNSAVDEFVDCVIDLLSTVELVDDTWMVDASWLDVHSLLHASQLLCSDSISLIFFD